MPEVTPPYRVGISGSYGGWNIGDEAILESMLQSLRRSVPVVFTVFTHDPKDTIRRHGIEHAVAVRELSRDEVRAHVAGLDVLVIGGGGILFDREAEIFLREATRPDSCCRSSASSTSQSACGCTPHSRGRHLDRTVPGSHGARHWRAI